MKRFVLGCALLMGPTALGPACSSDREVPASLAPSGGKAGLVHLNLSTGGETIQSVDMKLYSGTTAAGPPPIERHIDTHSTDSTISAFVGALAVGDYLVEFSATAENSGDACSGQQVFHVSANQMQSVLVTLTCGSGLGAPASGSAVIVDRVVATAACPYLTNVVIAPLQVAVGDTVQLSATASEQTSTLLWSAAAGGVIDAPSAPSTSLMCVTSGTKTISVQLTKANTACSDVVSAQVVCIGPDASVGAGGSGATGGSGGAFATGGNSTGFGGSPGGGGFQGGGCVACEAQKCVDPVNAVTATCTNGRCDALNTCIFTTGCDRTQLDPFTGELGIDGRNCYCGTDVDPTNFGLCFAATQTTDPFFPHGPCRTQIEALTGQTVPSSIGSVFFDPTSPLGAVMNLESRQ